MIIPFRSSGRAVSAGDAWWRRRVRALTAAKLRAVFCFVPLVHAAPVGSEALPVDIVEEQLEEESREALQAVLARVGLDSTVGEVLSGRPEDVLPELQADLLIVGALSRGRLKDLILGSTAERILEDTKSDLLVVKPVGFHSQVSHMSPRTPWSTRCFIPFKPGKAAAGMTIVSCARRAGSRRHLIVLHQCVGGEP